MEGAPKQHTAEVTQTAESAEILAENIAAAVTLNEALKTYRDVVVGREQWEELKGQARELDSIMQDIPDADRLGAGLPLRTPVEREMTEAVPFPTAAASGYAHTLDYTHAVIPREQQIAVDEQQEQSPGQLQTAANDNRAPQAAAA